MSDFQTNPFLERHECMYCDMVCSHLAGLRSHVYHKHTKGLLDGQSRATMWKKKPRSDGPKLEKAIHYCTLCDSPRMTLRKFEKHLSSIHGYDLTVHTLSFETAQEFLMWKLKYSAETCAEYAKSAMFFMQNKKLKVRPYSCNRNGYARNTGNEINNKNKASIKINGYCPARITAYHRENGRVDIKYVKTHIGHDQDLHRLKKSTLQYLKTKDLMAESTDPNVDKQLLQQIITTCADELKPAKEHMCVHCDFSHPKKHGMNEHLMTLHGYEMTQYAIDFLTFDDFNVWLKQYSDETSSRYVRHTNVLISTGRKILYVCHRDGTRRRGEKETKMKLNGYCPAHVAVVIHEDESVHATYIGTHVHEPTVLHAVRSPRDPKEPKPKVYPPRIRKKNKNSQLSGISPKVPLEVLPPVVATNLMSTLVELCPKTDDLMDGIVTNEHCYAGDTNTTDTELPESQVPSSSSSSDDRSKAIVFQRTESHGRKFEDKEAKETFITRVRSLINKNEHFHLMENVVSVLEASLGNEDFVFFKMLKNKQS